MHSFSTVKLSPSDLLYHNTLYQVAYREGKNKWWDIGTSLSLSEPDLVSIRKDHSTDVGECFRAMLLKWFQSSSDCYLDTFLSALKSEIVDLPNLCPKVEEAIIAISEQGNDRKRSTHRNGN